MAKKTKIRSSLAKKRRSFTAFIPVFTREVELQATEANKEVAKQIVTEARAALDEQKYDHKPLNPKYRQKKIDEGHDERILIRTKEYMESISWGVTHGRVWAGVPSRKIHRDSGLLLTVLARIHEFGTSRVPARPLWRPLISSILRRRSEFAAEYRKAAEETVKRLVG